MSRKLLRARAALANFWGHTNGGELAQDRVKQELKDLNLSAGDLDELADWLPTMREGVTGGSISRAEKIVLRMLRKKVDGERA